MIEGIGTGGKIQRIPGSGSLGDAVGSDGPSSAAWIQNHRERVAEALLEALMAFPDGAGRGRLLVVTGGTSMMRSEDLAASLLHTGVGLGVNRRPTTDPLSRQSQIAANRAQENGRATFQLWSRNGESATECADDE
jgi:hypothetical protein